MANRDLIIRRRERQRKLKKKKIGLMSKTYSNFARASLFFAHFFADNVKMPYFAFYGERKHAKMEFYFCL